MKCRLLIGGQSTRLGLPDALIQLLWLQHKLGLVGETALYAAIFHNEIFRFGIRNCRATFPGTDTSGINISCFYYSYIGTDPGPLANPFYILYIPIALGCPDPTYKYNGATNMCERPGANLIISLDGGTTTQPSTLLPFKAVVKDQNGVVQAGKQVTIAVNVQDGTGGHIHTENRPKGIFTCGSMGSPWTCTLTTDYGGLAPFEFVATPISGTHTITASCNGCSNTATKSVYVKVSGLIPIPASPQLYALQDSTGAVIGAIPGKHTANHYLTSTAILKLKRLSQIYIDANPRARLYLNDASLEWGGLFDVGRNTPWSSPHSSHDKGTSLDIRAANSGPNNEGSVPSTVFREFIGQAQRNRFRIGLHCRNSSDTNYCLGQPNNRHFHVDF